MGKRPTESLPLDDPRWITLKAAIDQRQQQTGAMPLAVMDLEKKMRSGELPWKCVDLATGEAEHGEPTFWNEHEADVIDIAGFAPVRIYRRIRERKRGELRRWGDHITFDNTARVRVDGHVYFVWKPRLDALFAPADTPTPVTPEAKPRPTPQLKHGGGRRRKLSDDQIERGRAYFRNELDRDPGWGEASFQSRCELVKGRLKLASHWQTVGVWIVTPVLIERGLPAPASASKNRAKN